MFRIIVSLQWVGPERIDIHLILMNNTSHPASVLKSLRHRLGLKPGEPFEMEVEACLSSVFDDASFTFLCLHSNYAVRAAGLALGYVHFPALSDDAVLSALFVNVEHENPRARDQTIQLTKLLAERNPSLAWASLGPEFLRIARSTISLDEEARGLEAEKRGLMETKQDDYNLEPLSEIYKDLVLELDVYRTKRFSSLGFAHQDDTDSQDGDMSVRSSRASSSGWSARRRLDSGAVVLMVHETVGWKSLESSLHGLNQLLRCCPPSNLTDVLTVVNQVVRHENRYVRVAGMELLCSLSPHSSPLMEKQIQRGMCDRVNAVRIQACLACKALLELGKNDDRRFKILGPAMCLNRHYPAEGVRAVSAEAWKASGYTTQHVQANAELFSEFFVQEAKTSRDEFAREASCIAMGELARLSSAQCERYVPALLARLSDSSWGVQAASCQALFEVVEHVSGQECVPALVEAASDLIWSVRDEAARTLARFAMKHPKSVMTACGELLHHPSDGHDHDHDHSHEEGIMFSCCSSEITDKTTLRKRDFQFVDGGVRLFRELLLASENTSIQDELCDLFVSAVLNGTKPWNDVVAETVFKLVQPVAEKMGKRPFKRALLDALIPRLVASGLESRTNSVAFQASSTCEFLRQWVGEKVFQARVESVSPALWDAMVRLPPTSFENQTVSFRVEKI